MKLQKTIVETLNEWLPAGWDKLIIGYFLDTGDQPPWVKVFIKFQNEYFDLGELANSDPNISRGIAWVRTLLEGHREDCAKQGNHWVRATLTMSPEGIEKEYGFTPEDFTPDFEKKWEEDHLVV